MQTSVDYDQVSQRYDNNPIRHNIGADLALNELKPGATVVDLACGTGLYLEAQRAAFPDLDIVYHGVDASIGMLSRAEERNPNIDFTRAQAEALPFGDETIDYIICRFAFHHFDDKEQVMREVFRVLKPRGKFKIVNFIPEASKDWWLYRFFPETVAFDKGRFTTIDQTLSLIRDYTDAVAYSFYPPQRILGRYIVEEARNRETSELVWLQDDLYKSGLKALEEFFSEQWDTEVDPKLVLGEVVAQKQT